MSAARTINLAVLHEVIWDVYQASDTVPTYTVCTVRNKLLVIWLNTTQHINWRHILAIFIRSMFKILGLYDAILEGN